MTILFDQSRFFTSISSPSNYPSLCPTLTSPLILLCLKLPTSHSAVAQYLSLFQFSLASLMYQFGLLQMPASINPKQSGLCERKKKRKFFSSISGRYCLISQVQLDLTLKYCHLWLCHHCVGSMFRWEVAAVVPVYTVTDSVSKVKIQLLLQSQRNKEP